MVYQAHRSTRGISEASLFGLPFVAGYYPGETQTKTEGRPPHEPAYANFPTPAVSGFTSIYSIGPETANLGKQAATHILFDTIQELTGAGNGLQWTS